MCDPGALAGAGRRPNAPVAHCLQASPGLGFPPLLWGPHESLGEAPRAAGLWEGLPPPRCAGERQVPPAPAGTGLGLHRPAPAYPAPASPGASCLSPPGGAAGLLGGGCCERKPRPASCCHIRTPPGATGVGGSRGGAQVPGPLRDGCLPQSRGHRRTCGDLGAGLRASGAPPWCGAGTVTSSWILGGAALASGPGSRRGCRASSHGLATGGHVVFPDFLTVCMCGSLCCVGAVSAWCVCTRVCAWVGPCVVEGCVWAGCVHTHVHV